MSTHNVCFLQEIGKNYIHVAHNLDTPLSKSYGVLVPGQVN